MADELVDAADNSAGLYAVCEIEGYLLFAAAVV